MAQKKVVTYQHTINHRGKGHHLRNSCSDVFAVQRLRSKCHTACTICDQPNNRRHENQSNRQRARHLLGYLICVFNADTSLRDNSTMQLCYIFVEI